MIRKKLITKYPTKKDGHEVVDSASTEESSHKSSEIQQDEAGRETVGQETDNSSVDPNLEQVTDLEHHDEGMGASTDQHAEGQETPKAEPHPATIATAQPAETTTDVEPETEEVEEEVRISEELLQYVFRSETNEPIPLLEERLACLHEAGKVLHEVFPHTIRMSM